MQFSQRTAWSLEESELAQAHRLRVEAELPIFDLTASNPTQCGFAYPTDLLEPLMDPASLEYSPDPLGSLRAREAVCRYYQDHGVQAKPEQVLLTTSTSEAYSYLFKLLADPGEQMLVPQPSYPLFDYLADAEAIQILPVSLVYDFGWQLDLESLRRRVTPKTRAVVIVHPNNPTGHFTKLHEALELAAICREHGLALIVDEVFLDYALAGEEANQTSFGKWDLGIPVFIVSGISKICALPQMKAAWLLATGTGSAEAMQRLEMLADTFLSMNAPIQRALPVWLERRGELQGQLALRVGANLQKLDCALAAQPQEMRLANRLVVEAGWYAILRIPAVRPDEETVRVLLERGVWVHPGYFFGMPQTGWLVLSLLPEGVDFASGLGVLMEELRRNQESYPMR